MEAPLLEEFVMGCSKEFTRFWPLMRHQLRTLDAQYSFLNERP